MLLPGSLVPDLQAASISAPNPCFEWSWSEQALSQAYNEVQIGAGTLSHSLLLLQPWTWQDKHLVWTENTL
jgi:hypothetical protein